MSIHYSAIRRISLILLFSFLPSNTKSKKRSRRDRSETPSSSEDERRRRRREKKERRRRKEKDREREKDKKEHRKEKRKHTAKSDDEESDDESGRDRHRRDRRSRERSRHDSRREGTNSLERGRRRSDGDEDIEEANHRSRSWDRERSQSRSMSAAHLTHDDENGVPRNSLRDMDTSFSKMNFPDPSRMAQQADESDDDVGPQPVLKATTTRKVDEREYGGALLRGEGSAMAAFLQEGGTEARIPRRGEIGLTSDEIASFEAVGYVMSGSRHKRMNAVRMRKENQVISAEEKRAILKLQKEEKERREAILREEFKQLVDDSLKGATTKKPV